MAFLPVCSPPGDRSILMLHLTNVTLVCVDCIDADRAHGAMVKSSKDIRFADSKLLTSLDCNYEERVAIRCLSSKEDYSHFVIKELYQFIETKFVLIVQYDGYVLNVNAWRSEWLDYDYIGAPWLHLSPKRIVGNGGFSLRSKRLMDAIATEPSISELHPEDYHICRTYRPLLELSGIKFAPVEEAERFSVEVGSYTGQFGFHGLQLLHEMNG